MIVPSPRMRTQCSRRPTPWRVRSLNTCPQKRSCITCPRNLIYWHDARAPTPVARERERQGEERERGKRKRERERERLDNRREIEVPVARFRGRNCRDMHRARLRIDRPYLENAPAGFCPPGTEREFFISNVTRISLDLTSQKFR